MNWNQIWFRRNEAISVVNFAVPFSLQCPLKKNNLKTFENFCFRSKRDKFSGSGTGRSPKVRLDDDTDSCSSRGGQKSNTSGGKRGSKHQTTTGGRATLTWKKGRERRTEFCVKRLINMLNSRKSSSSISRWCITWIQLFEKNLQDLKFNLLFNDKNWFRYGKYR